MRENRGFISICTLLGLYAWFQVHESQWESSIVDFLPVLFCGGVGLVLFFIALFRVLKRADLHLNRRLVPLYFWAGPILVGVSYNAWLNRIKLAPNYMCANTGSDAIMAGFDFKKDGRYKYWEGSPLGIFYNYGTYVRQDSLIILSPESERNAPSATRFIIRPYSQPSSFTDKSILYAVNHDGNVVNTMNGYYITMLAGK